MSPKIGRAVGLAAGIVNHAFFFVTVWFLYFFLAGENRLGRPGSGWINLLLAFQFAIPHSVLLLPSTRRRITFVLPSPFYGTLFCFATCVSLMTAIYFWQSSDVVIYAFEGAMANLMRLAFWGTWFVLLYSIHLTGLGYQTGLTPWWHWIRRQPEPRREFRPRSLYLWMRHPIYVSFLGLLWFTPVVTLDRLVLNLIWTVYIFVGSILKDRRLEHYLGDSYRDYQTQVTGFPGVLWGPLARLRH